MAPTKAQRDKAARIVAYEVRDPLTETRKCRWCGWDAPEEAQAGGEYLCPTDRDQKGCGRWQHEKAFPDGVPGLTQTTETCRWCGEASDWAPDEDDAMKRCPACRADMHPAAALRFHGQAIVPEIVDAGRPFGLVALTAPDGARRYRTATDPTDLPEDARG